MLIPLLGAGALIGLYLYEKNKHPVVAQAEAVPPPSPNAPPASSAVTPTGGIINYSPPKPVPGFNNNIIYTQPVQTQGATYPPATTLTNPASSQGKGNVAAYQAAQPVSSGLSYYPAPGDIGSIVMARLGGAKAIVENGKKILDPNQAKAGGTLPTMDSANVGKLNGFVGGFSDINEWITKKNKPLLLPLGGYSDVAGPVVGAMGVIK